MLLVAQSGDLSDFPNSFSRHLGEYGRLSQSPNTYEKDRSPPQSPVLWLHAGVGLTTPGGVATPDSAAPSSSCFLRLRERCFGPATMTTTIAATICSPK